MTTDNEKSSLSVKRIGQKDASLTLVLSNITENGSQIECESQDKMTKAQKVNSIKGQKDSMTKGQNDNMTIVQKDNSTKKQYDELKVLELLDQLSIHELMFLRDTIQVKLDLIFFEYLEEYKNEL